MDTINKIIQAAAFAADKHRNQRRKGNNDIPYINHPLKVASLLGECGENDADLLLAAILHDTLEDTETTSAELCSLFGTTVTKLVEEVSDEKDQPYMVRKQYQIDHAHLLSNNAKKIKLADKTCNMRDILTYPLDWTTERKLEYFLWAEKVIFHCYGLNPKLDHLFNGVLKKGKEQLK